MAEKNISARIVHKHDIEENWLKAVNFIPKQGEIIVYDVDDNYNYERIKIGDGARNVNDLPFAIDAVSANNQSDWLQTDHTKPDYIKNKPFGDIINATDISGATYIIGGFTSGALTVTHDAIPLEVGQVWSVQGTNDANAKTVSVQVNDAGELYLGTPTVNDMPFYIRATETTLNSSYWYQMQPSHLTLTCVSGVVTTTSIKYLDPKYIKDMYYDNIVEDILVDNLTSDEYSAGNYPQCTFIEGNTYNIVWNGVLYENVVCTLYDGWRILGGIEGYPFYIDDDGGSNLYIEANGESYTVSIIHIISNPTRIHRKYLPYSIADWDVNDESANNYIQNRPFYDVTTYTLVSNDELAELLSDVNMTTNSAHIFRVVINGIVYDDVPGTYGYMTAGYIGVGDKPDSSGWQTTDFGFYYSKLRDSATADWGLVVNTDILPDVDSSTATVEVYLKNRELKQIDVKYLPDNMGSKVIKHINTDGSMTLDDLKSLEDGMYIFDKAFVFTPYGSSKEMNVKGLVRSVRTSSHYIYCYDLNVCLSTYYGTYYAESLAPIVGVSDTTSSGLVRYRERRENDTVPVSTHDGYLYVDAVTTSAQLLTEEQKVQARANIGAIGEQAQPDWSVNDENANGYVKNRTHYICETSGVIFPETHLEKPIDSSSMSLNGIDVDVIANSEYSIKWNGENYTCTSVEFESNGILGMFIGNVGLINGTGDSGEPFVICIVPNDFVTNDVEKAFVVPLDESTEATMSISGPYYEYHKLDERYIPGVHIKEINKDGNMTNEDFLSLADGMYFIYGSPLPCGQGLVRIFNGYWICYDYGYVYGSIYIDGDNLITDEYGAIDGFGYDEYINLNSRIFPNDITEGQTVVVSFDELGNATFKAKDYSEQVQTDWNSNDTDNITYIKNRPFYAEREVVFKSRKFSGNLLEPHVLESTLTLKDGASYYAKGVYSCNRSANLINVEFEGTYKCVNGEIAIFPYENTGEPVLIIRPNQVYIGLGNNYDEASATFYTLEELTKYHKIDANYLPDNLATTEYVDDAISTFKPKLTTVNISAANWTGDANPWSQVVDINGVTINSKIDLQPTAVQIVELQNKEITLMLQNDNGVVTAWAIGNKPTNDYTMQVLIQEVVSV